MKTEHVSLKLGERPVNDKIEFAKNIVISMMGNSLFASLASFLPAVTTAITNIENANIAALDGGKSKKALLHQMEAVLDNLLRQLGNQVEALATASAAAGGDAQAVITSAGMDYAKSKSVLPVPAAPQNMTAASTLNEGEIALEWDAVHGAHAYMVELTIDPSIVGSRIAAPISGGVITPVVWTLVKILTQKKFTITGLNSGTKYAVRVYCVGTHGISSYSNVVVAKAL